jgi:FkbM family methyltransferase
VRRISGIYEAQTPMGPLLLTEVTDTYAGKVAFDSERLEFEKEVSNLVNTLEYDTFVDIGAGFGYYSLMAGARERLVLSFEPHPIRYGFLVWNTNHLDNVLCFPYFVNNRSTDIATTENPLGLYGHTSEVPKTLNANGNFIHINHILKTMIQGKSLIKVDVEGFEYDIMSGVDPDCLAAHSWIIELHPNGPISPEDFRGQHPNHQVLEERPDGNVIIYLE